MRNSALNPRCSNIARSLPSIGYWAGYEVGRLRENGEHIYAQLDPRNQRNYETGHMLAIAYRTLFNREPPPWPYGTVAPPALIDGRQQIIEWEELTGKCLPPRALALQYEPETLGPPRPIAGRGRGKRWRPAPIPTYCPT